MPYIGNEVGNRFVASKAASVYSGNGSTTAFTLEHAVGSDEDILVSVDGVVQEPSVAYAVSSGTTLTFTAAPSSNSGNNIFVYYLFRTVATVDHPSTSSLQATDGTFSSTLNVTGVLTGTSLDISGDIDVDGTTNLDVVDIDGTLNVAGEATLQTHLNMGDSDIIKLGASADLQLFHDASNSFVKDAGTGSLIIEGANVQIQDTQQDLLAKFNNAGAVQLFHVDSGTSNVKLATSGTGATVTGVLSVTTSVSSNNTAKVWANLNGASFGLRDSFNVSSASDEGTGNYNFNYTANLANSNYSIEMGNSFDGTGAWATFDAASQNPTVSLWNMRIINRNGGASDSAHAMFAIHGD